ncbi:cell division protein FtsQ/DivIB [Aurantivibrio infirmus]
MKILSPSKGKPNLDTSETRTKNAVGRHYRKENTADKKNITKKTANRNGALRNSKGSSAARFEFTQYFVRMFLVVSAASLVCVAVYVGNGFMEKASARPINHISVEGKFKYLSKQSVSEIVSPMIEDGFLQLPLEEIKSSLEENPWVQQAIVSRRWPDKFYISITEEQPIARWGKTGFLNQRGDIVVVDQHGFLNDLPLLSGNLGQEKSIMLYYQQLTQLLRPYDMQIAEFYCDELMSWHLTLGSGLSITIGKDQVTEKIQRFLDVYKRSLQVQIDNIAGVDLRYGNGLSVQWKQQKDGMLASHSGSFPSL